MDAKTAIQKIQQFNGLLDDELVGEISSLLQNQAANQCYASEELKTRERAEQSEAQAAVMRPEVRWFAEKMEQTLRANDHKSGWGDCEFRWLLGRINEEVLELQLACNGLTGAEEIGKTTDCPIDGETIIREATDVANFAMMIADNIRAEPLPTQAASTLLAEHKRYREALEQLSEYQFGWDYSWVARTALNKEESK